MNDRSEGDRELIARIESAVATLNVLLAEAAKAGISYDIEEFEFNTIGQAKHVKAVHVFGFRRIEWL